MNLANRNYHEKRCYIRMKVETPIDVLVDGQAPLRGTCHNLSGGGMLISLSETLPLGTQLEVSVSSNHGHNPVLKAVAQVSRVQSQPHMSAKPCMLGLSILEMIE